LADNAQVKSEQRVACPQCGRLLFIIEKVDDVETASFMIGAKCKSGGCHRKSQVIYRHGRLTVSLL